MDTFYLVISIIFGIATGIGIGLCTIAVMLKKDNSIGDEKGKWQDYT